MRRPERTCLPEFLQGGEYVGCVFIGPREIVPLKTVSMEGAAENLRPMGNRHNGLFRHRVVMGPALRMFFRPEEVHAASGHPPGHFSGQGPGEGDVHVPHGRRWGDLEYILVPHAYRDGFAAIQAAGIDADLSAGEKPAHGQRFDPSLAVPFLLSPYRDEKVGRHVGKRRPGLHVVRVFHEPARDRGVGRPVL